MNLADRLLFRLELFTRALLRNLWMRFLRFTLIGKGFATAIAVFVAAWSVAQLGLDALGRELAEIAWLLMSIVLTAVVIRHIWLRFTHRSRYSTWY